MTAILAILCAIFSGAFAAFWEALKAGLPLLGCVALMVAVSGCQPNVEPIERSTNTMINEVLKPAVDKLSTELSTRTAQLQGQGSLINPGYKITGYASFGPAVTYNFEIGAIGVSANLAGATQMDQGQATTDKRDPGDRAPADKSEPAKSSAP